MKLRILFIFAVILSGAFATEMRFSDFTPEPSPQGTDWLAGYRSAGVAGGNRRWSLNTLSGYFGTNISGLTSNQIASVDYSSLINAPTFILASSQSLSDAQKAQARANIGSPAVQSWAGYSNFLKAGAYGIANVSASANYTFTREIPCETAFTHVRVVFYNAAPTAATWGFVAVAAAPTSGADGTSLTWYPVYFNAPTLPQTQIGLSSGTTRSVTVPAAVGSSTFAIPSFAYSDWVAISSVARSDSGTKPLLQVRCWENSALGALNWDSTSQANYNTALPGREIKTAVTGDTDGSKVTSAASYAIVPSTSANWYAPFYIEYRTANRGVTVLIIGDSLSTSQIADSGNGNRTASWALRACAAVSTTSLPVACLPMVFPGTPSGSFIETATTCINNAKPDILVISGGSPNDGIATVGDQWTNILKVIGYARSRGIQVVVSTVAPWGSNDATASAPRLTLNANIRAAAAYGLFTLLDFDALLRDTGNPLVLASAYDSGGTHLHWNEAGVAAAASAFTPILSSIVATGK